MNKKNMELAKLKNYEKPFHVEHGGGGFVIVDAAQELVADFFSADDAAEIACEALNK